MNRPSLPYLPGLDGLRAIAVIAVLLYHGQDVAGIGSWLKPQGGFLGVEVFFVISGFLITALLVREHEASSSIGLKSFWIRRARRLLPALYVFLGGTIALAALFGSDALDKIRREILGALFYVSNWLLIATDESYFDTAGRPSLLRHLWSLAIEEQFYLLWPLVVWLGLRVLGRKGLFALTVLGAAASTALMWRLFDQVPQYGDVTEVYYRTDARAAALLVGAALAFAWSPWAGHDGTGRTQVSEVRRWALDVVGVAALAVVVALQFVFTDRLIEWDSYVRLYHGGFLVLSIATVAVIAAVATPGSRLGWVLGNPAMRWIGTRSYGLYLWHWPVFQLTRPRLDVDIDGYLLLAVRLAMTVALTEASYRLIELPVRQRRFFEVARTPRGILAASVAALTLVVTTAGVALAMPTIERSTSTAEVAVSAEPDPAAPVSEPNSTANAADAPPLAAPEVETAADPTTEREVETAATPTPGTDPADPESDEGEEANEEDRAALGDGTDGQEPGGETDEERSEGAETGAEESGQDRAAEAESNGAAGAAVVETADLIAGNFEALPAPTPTQTPLPPPPPLTQPFDMAASRIHIVGDSVIEGARGQLARISPTVTIDGRIGRQWWELEGELRQMRSHGLANDVVVIQLGNNGNFTHQMFDGVMNALSGTRLVVFVNIHAPVVWEGEVNGMLASNVGRYPEQARLIDWYTAASGHPEYFIEDGTHLDGKGMVAFRLLIENTLLALS